MKLTIMTALALSVGHFTQAAEIDNTFVISRPKASLFQIENEGDYLFVVNAIVKPTHLTPNLPAYAKNTEGRDARLFKGPIDGLQELLCSTSYLSPEQGLPEFEEIVTDMGTLSLHNMQWTDRYENAFNLTHIKKESNQALFKKIIFKNQDTKTTQAQKIAKPGLSQSTDLAPKSRLYKVDGLDKYFFVGYNKVTYYTDESGAFQSRILDRDHPIRCEGYNARIFFGVYPQLIEEHTIQSFYPCGSTFGPFTLIGYGWTTSSLNLMNNKWTSGNDVYQLLHIEKQGNEEFYSKIKLVPRQK